MKVWLRTWLLVAVLFGAFVAFDAYFVKSAVFHFTDFVGIIVISGFAAGVHAIGVLMSKRKEVK